MTTDKNILLVETVYVLYQITHYNKLDYNMLLILSDKIWKDYRLKKMRFYHILGNSKLYCNRLQIKSDYN